MTRAMDPVIIPRLATQDQLQARFVERYREFWQSYTYRDEFIPGFRDCYYCGQFGTETPAVRRIDVNVWGTICERDVCEAHARTDGCRVDD